MFEIKGIGGGGKTTLARAVYDRISTMFEGKSFVENVREVLKPSLSGLKKLQKRILKDVLNEQDITFSSVHDGTEMLIATMRRRRILVVLDDVDCIEQLEALAGESNWYAFETEIPTRGYEELSRQIVQYAHGLPLTIKVLGLFLCDQNEPEWIDAIKRLKTIPLKATMERLELSYNGLEEDYWKYF
ncbi:Toll/interleukin-1 receptor domain-containing protein [Tanacetum coccineum]